MSSPIDARQSHSTFATPINLPLDERTSEIRNLFRLAFAEITRDLESALAEARVEMQEPESVKDGLKKVVSSSLNPNSLDDEQLKELKNKLIENSSQKQIKDLKMWLKRLSWTASSESENNKRFFSTVLTLLQLTASDSVYKQDVFYPTLNEAVKTCGDKIALSVIDLDLHRQVESLDSSKLELSEIAEFLIRGPFIIEKLKNQAQIFVEVFRAEQQPNDVSQEIEDKIDEVEIYLGLPIKLKEEFQIPICLDEMRFFNSSELKQEHIDITRNSLNDSLQDENELLSFLVQHSKWIETLENTYPQKMKYFKERRDKALENPETSLDGLDSYTRSLKRYTKAYLPIFLKS